MKVKILSHPNKPELEAQLEDFLMEGWEVIGFTGPGGHGDPNYHVLLQYDPYNEWG